MASKYCTVSGSYGCTELVRMAANSVILTFHSATAVEHGTALHDVGFHRSANGNTSHYHNSCPSIPNGSGICRYRTPRNCLQQCSVDGLGWLLQANYR